ncbi:MAG: hypothetical protein C0478_05935 [Planctomyces sp.]|nr:hypothetical protein [Planctomyces sp.]
MARIRLRPRRLRIITWPSIPSWSAVVQIKPHLSLPELKRIERAEKDADRVRRLRIVILGIEGWTAPAIAMAVGLSRRICQRWAARYNDEGLQGLDDRRGNQAGLPLNPEQQAEFQARIEDDPTPEDTVCALRGKDLQRILEREFQLLRSLSSVYWLLHKLGYSSLLARSIPAPTRRPSHSSKPVGGNDSTRSPDSIPRSGCGSTSRTSRGSDNRGR